MERTWIDTCKNFGYPALRDPRRGVNLGAYSQLMCIDPKTKTRSYSYTGYIEPNQDRPNLKVLTNAKAGKILLSKDGDEAIATGVKFFVGRKEYTVSAGREVIFSAGTIQTPQLLELSGIGDRSLLEKRGIEVNVDNPAVGRNLQDHPLCPITYVSCICRQ
jgi:choline dehydrogenase